MKKKWILPAAAILCTLALITMTLALIWSGKQKEYAVFTPPPFDPAAMSGTPAVDSALGWSEIYQDGMGFRAYVCGNVIAEDDTADVYFTNCEGFNVWLKLRIFDDNGNILGETGLIRPGEYVKSVILTADVRDGQNIKLKIMAYEPDTYYSAGAVMLNTVITKGDAE